MQKFPPPGFSNVWYVCTLSIQETFHHKQFALYGKQDDYSIYIPVCMIYMQNYYRGCNGTLIFIDLVQFSTTNKRDDLILYTENLIKDIEFRIGKKPPCLLVGAKVNPTVMLHIRMLLISYHLHCILS